MVLRRDVYVVCRIRPVVLDTPPDIGEPERVLGLGRHAVVDEHVAHVDPDDASPGPLTDDGTELLDLEDVAEDVAVGAGELVGEANEGARR
jgi:hypothetical protein